MEVNFSMARPKTLGVLRPEADDVRIGELTVPLGGTGYLALLSIDDNMAVTLAAVRHQREDDYRCVFQPSA